MTNAHALTSARLAQLQRVDTFDVRSELQGLYDAMSQASLQFMTAAEIDEFHTVLTTSAWTFVDETGRKHHRSQMGVDAIHALVAPRPDSITQTIGRLSLDGNVATVLINRTTVRSLARRPGRGGARTLAAVTTFRDRWIRVVGEWKLQSRQQIGKSVESVVRGSGCV